MVGSILSEDGTDLQRSRWYTDRRLLCMEYHDTLSDQEKLKTKYMKTEVPLHDLWSCAQKGDWRIRAKAVLEHLYKISTVIDNIKT